MTDALDRIRYDDPTAPKLFDPCPCDDLVALNHLEFGDYMRCTDCNTQYDTDGSRL